MLSSDKNIETLSQLIEMLKHDIELRTEYVKIDAVGKMARLFSATILFIILFLISLAVLIFASAAVAFWLSQYIGLTQAFFALAGVYVLLLLVVYLSRKSWIERPLVKFLAKVLMN